SDSVSAYTNKIFESAMAGLETVKNNLDIAGHLGDQWALDANINAPGLNGLVPGLAGVIKGKVNVRGDINKPKIIADINAQGIKWQDQLSVGSVVVKGDIQSDD
ncbi:hypothetical protein SJ059_26925, partial [Klebsiella aerogenes]|nr:hypothetical protein [Klebsiella aerogenes]